MPGWMHRSGGEPTPAERVRRLRERIGRLRGQAIAAVTELQRAYGNLTTAPADMQDRRRLAAMFQDERVARAVPGARERIGRLWEEVDALAGAPEEIQARDVEALEAAADQYERELVALRAWFLTRAVITLGAGGQLAEPGPARETLQRSLAVDRTLMPTAELIIRCDVLTKVGGAKAALDDAAAAAARPDADVRALKVHAATLLLADRTLEAAAAFRRAYDASPDKDVDLLVHAGSALLTAGCHDDALGTADEVLRLDPANARALDLRADALRFLGRMEEAEAVYRRILALPDPPAAELGLLGVLAALGRDDEADDLVDAIVNDPASSPARVAIALYTAHRYLEAASSSLAALADPTLAGGPRATLERLQGAFDCAIGCVDQGLEALDRVIARKPQDGDLEDCRSIALTLQGRFAEAADAARRAIALMGRSEYGSTLSLALRSAGDPASALAYARSSFEGRRGRAEGIAELVLCLVQLGRVPEAREFAAVLPPDTARDPHALYARAALAVADGDRATAGRFLARAAEIRPEFGLRAIVDPVFNDGRVLDDARRAALRSQIDANELRRVSLAGGAPRIHAGDALVIQALAQHADLGSPREVSHWLYFPDRAAAEDAATSLRSDGYAATVEPSAAGDGRWCTRAVHYVAVSPASVAAARASMERLASRLGGEYDGWEAAVTP